MKPDKSIVNKWYYGLIISPFLLALIDKYILEDSAFNSITTILFYSFSILALVMTWELFELLRYYKSKIHTINESDKKIVSRLLSQLDVNTFQEYIYEQDSWYGYSANAVRNVIYFIDESTKISNTLMDEKIKPLFTDLIHSLDDFVDYSSKKMYATPTNLYALNKNNQEAYEQALVEREKINAMAKDSFEKLQALILKLREVGYL